MQNENAVRRGQHFTLFSEFALLIAGRTFRLVVAGKESPDTCNECHNHDDRYNSDTIILPIHSRQIKSDVTM